MLNMATEQHWTSFHPCCISVFPLPRFVLIAIVMGASYRFLHRGSLPFSLLHFAGPGGGKKKLEISPGTVA